MGSTVSPVTLNGRGERMGTRQALSRVHMQFHNWERQEEKLIASLLNLLHQLGGYILDVAVVLQVVAGVVILLGDPEPLRSTVYYLQNIGWFYVLQREAFGLLLLFSLITGIWGMAKREIPQRLIRTTIRFAVWFTKIGASVGLK